MNLYEMFETSQKLEQEGVVFDYGDCKIILARSGGSNAKYQKALAEKVRPLAKKLRAGVIAPEEVERVNREAFVEAVLVGWEGVTDRNGKPLEFTKENAMKLLEDLPELYNELSRLANDFTNYRAEVTQATKKN